MGASNSTSNEKHELQQLEKGRDQLTAELTRFDQYLNKFSPENDDIEPLQIRLEKIEPILDDFKHIQNSIEELLISDSSLGNTTGDEHEVFEDRYYDVIARARKIVQNTVNEPSAPEGTSANDQSILYVTSSQVPQLPQFSGAHHDWQRFHDDFMTMVYNNNSLSNNDKFNCLKNCLAGELAEIIACLPDAQANFTTVWEILKARFENRKIIVNSHLKEIVDLPVLSKVSHTFIKNLHNTFLKNVSALESLGENVKDWDTILIYLVISKLDFNSRREWESFSKDIRFLKVSHLNIFLTNRYRILEGKFSNTNQRQTQDSRGPGISGVRNPTCSFCKGSHVIFACRQFKSLSVDSRLQRVIELKICKNCLRPGHKVRDCHTSNVCKKCGAKHATLLHQSVGQQGNQQETPQVQQVQVQSRQQVDSEMSLGLRAAVTLVTNYLNWNR
uniref:CCHC-type domain-containing protein n=1 Tax=Photinus pyralis TaxID=7054 RepID=A0A1Y1MFQ3_PHOPY